MKKTLPVTEFIMGLRFYYSLACVDLCADYYHDVIHRISWSRDGASLGTCPLQKIPPSPTNIYHFLRKLRTVDTPVRFSYPIGTIKLM